MEGFTRKRCGFEEGREGMAIGNCSIVEHLGEKLKGVARWGDVRIGSYQGIVEESSPPFPRRRIRGIRV